MLLLYRLFINLIITISPIIIIFRLFKKKEDKKRFKEKFCIFSKKRKRGKLIWFHGASVGEILSIIPIIERLEQNKDIQQILITSTTLSSSKIFKKFKFEKTIHQFFPIDSNLLCKKFLLFWKPSLAIFIESEIWPNMLINLKKESIPHILLNARITKKSYKRWKFINKFSKNLFLNFNLTLPQNFETLNFLKNLNVKKIKYIGNVKFSNNKQDKTIFDDKYLINQFRDKKIFCAASTHPGEDLVCAKVHKVLKKKHKNLITIIIPRHINRADIIKNEIEEIGLNIITRTSNKKINKNTDIYLVDTYGETKKFYKISNTVFLGGSLVKRGGQNPIEPARLGCNIVHGPNIDNFKDVYKLLGNRKISHKVKNQNKLVELINNFIKNSKNQKNKSLKLNKMGKIILDKYIDEINNFLVK